MHLAHEIKRIAEMTNFQSTMQTHPPTNSSFNAKDTASLLIVGLFLLLAFYAAVGPNRVLPGDEGRFIISAQDFVHDLSLSHLKHYEEMSTPLPFIIYGLWGKMVGFELWRMRLGAILITLATLYQLAICCRTCLTRRRDAWLFAITLCLGNPYFLPMGTMVYTDMPALFFLLLSLQANVRENKINMVLGCAGMLLCRQYLIFMVIALGLFQMIRWIYHPQQRSRAMAMSLSILAGLMPFLGLVLLWRGLTPDNAMKSIYLGEPRTFHITSLVLYCSLVFWFSLPVLAVRCRLLKFKRAEVLSALLLSQVYWFFPVRPSLCSVRVDIHTVGLVHRLLNMLQSSGHLATLFFYVGFLICIALLCNIGRRTASIFGKGSDNLAPLLPIIGLACFLLVMPWSYLHWEKYDLPVIPLTLLMLLDLPGRNEQHHLCSDTLS